MTDYYRNMELIHRRFPEDKKCSKCGKTYTRSTYYYNLNNQNADGLHTYCKKCRSEMAAKKRNPDRSRRSKRINF